MSRAVVAFTDQPLYGHLPNGVEIEREASWRLEIEFYRGESHPDDRCGGAEECEVRAILLKWDGNRTRAEAVQRFGLDVVKRQEEWIATIYDPNDA